jgi:hypothetical protein
MKIKIALMMIIFFLIAGGAYTYHKDVNPAPNGIKMPRDYKNWRLVASSYRSDNNTMRVILGNNRAIEAVRKGNTNPWPNGVILAKLVWKNKAHKKWPAATIPGEFVHVEFMIKNSEKFVSTGGWGFARWKGMQQRPYGESADFVMECFGCHTPVKDNDYVFTQPAVIP